MERKRTLALLIALVMAVFVVGLLNPVVTTTAFAAEGDEWDPDNPDNPFDPNDPYPEGGYYETEYGISHDPGCLDPASLAWIEFYEYPDYSCTNEDERHYYRLECQSCKTSFLQTEDWQYVLNDTDAYSHPYYSCQHETTYTYRYPPFESCTEDGWYYYECANCGHRVMGDEIPAVGHDYVLQDDGSNRCSRCGDTFQASVERLDGSVANLSPANFKRMDDYAYEYNGYEYLVYFDNAFQEGPFYKDIDDYYQYYERGVYGTRDGSIVIFSVYNFIDFRVFNKEGVEIQLQKNEPEVLARLNTETDPFDTSIESMYSFVPEKGEEYFVVRDGVNLANIGQGFEFTVSDEIYETTHEDGTWKVSSRANSLSIEPSRFIGPMMMRVDRYTHRYEYYEKWLFVLPDSFDWGSYGACFDVTIQRNTEGDTASVVLTSKPGSGFYGTYVFEDVIVFTNDDLGNCVITFDPGEGTGSMESVTVEYGSSYVLPECTFTPPEGKLFDGWYIEGDAYPSQPGVETIVKKDMTIEACYRDPYKCGFGVYSRTTMTYGSVADVSVTPEGDIYEGDTVTVEAPDVDGLKFLGWYEASGLNGSRIDYDKNKKLSSEHVYTFTADIDIVGVVAVYETIQYARVTINQGNDAKFYVGDDPTLQSGAVTMDMPMGSTLRVTAQDAGSVLQWENEGNKVLGTGGSIEVVITRDMTITLLYNTPNQNQSYIQFVSDYDQVLSGRQYGVDSSVELAPAPTKYGYTFEKWVIEGTNAEATPAAIQELIGQNKVITLKPVYSKDMTQYVITVQYVDEQGESVADDTTESLVIGTGYTATAPEVAGYTISCWKDAEGNVLGYGDSYFMRVSGGVTIRACYVPEGSSVAEAEPVITLDEPYAVDAGSGVHKVACVATRSVPAGYTVLEQGMLYACGVDGLDESTFVCDNDSIGKYLGNSQSSSGVLCLNVKVDSDNTKVSFRGYMILRSASDDELITVYTDIVETTYSQLS